jgi:hypothetical protein
MNVTAQMTHAWPEVYIEGVGWIPFEPTPGYGQVRYTPWMLKSEQKSDEGEPERYVEPMEEEPEEELPSEEVLKEETEKKHNIAKVIAVMLGIIISGGLILLLAERFLFVLKYKKMLWKEQFQVQIKRMEMLLACLGYVREKEETLTELQQRIAEGMEGRQLSTFTAYERYLYGGSSITEEAVELVKKENLQLLQLLKRKRRWYYYYICFRYGIPKGEKSNG